MVHYEEMIDIISAILFIGGGGSLLAWSSSRILKSSELLGSRFRLPSIVTGALFVGVGTSLPELSTSIIGVFRGAADVVVPTIIGSNIFNILWILGLGILFQLRLKKQTRQWKDIFAIILAFLGSISLILTGATFVSGIILIVCFVVAMGLIIRPETQSARSLHIPGHLGKTIVILLISLFLLWAGSELLLRGINTLVHVLEIERGVLSLVLVAFATSLPELTVSVHGFFTRRESLAFGNILGSTIANPLLIGGLAGLLGPLPSLSSMQWEIVLFSSIACGLLILPLVVRRTLSRWIGAGYLGLFVLYILFIFIPR